MSERENILARVREALRVAAPKPGEAHAQAVVHGSGDVARANPRRWLPSVGNGFDAALAMFRAKAAELQADFRLVGDVDEVCRVLAELRTSENWKKVGAGTGELVRAAVDSLSLPVCRTEAGYDVRDLEDCSAGLTECDALIAQTGSILLTAGTGGGRGLSVLPPHHVVLARRGQMVADLPAAFELLKAKYGQRYPSFISFISGPSRTGDIERILVLGAHGPKKLTILCC